MDKGRILLNGQPMQRSVTTRFDFELIYFLSCFSYFKYSLDEMGGKCVGHSE
jgi:hypothetical protein